MGDVGVSLAEIIEVRGCGLSDDELLALIIIGCEVLTKTAAGVFSPEQVIVHTDGELEIKSVTKDDVSIEYLPPEMREGNTDVDPGAVHVYCLGEVVRYAGAAESGNTDLFSLLNVMTVAHVGTRPSITRLGQMAKNKLLIQNPKALLAEMYVLVMGDEAEDIDDLEISFGEYAPNSLGENGDVNYIEWNHGRAETVKSDTSGRPKVLLEEDSYDEGNGDSYLLEKSPDAIKADEYKSSELLRKASDNKNDQELKEKEDRLSVSTSEMAYEQDEESMELKSRNYALTHPSSYDFDGDIVEYEEEKDTSNEYIRQMSVPADRTTAYDNHKRFSGELMSEVSNTPTSLSPISEVSEEKVDEGQKTTTSITTTSDYRASSDRDSSLRRHDGELLVTDKIEEQGRTDFLSKSSDTESSLRGHDGQLPVADKAEEQEETNFLPKENGIERLKVESKSNEVLSTNGNASEQQFSRRNSLLPNRISGRKHSSRRFVRRLKAEPEFVRNIDTPSVCLKAPALRKKKVTLHRIEHTDVTVELLNGKHVEVSCRSDAVASEIADVVMRHMNFNENSFIGLTVLRDGEHFFLDDHQHLEKFAPPGWKNSRQHGSSKKLYMLYLRFRYYPASINFIRTEVVLHELYLQLRRDILDDRLQPKRDLYDLAALALQAEYSDRPVVALSDYFNVRHYMPKRCLDNCNEKTVVREIIEKHGKCRGLKQQDAEKRFILLCQRLPDYGAHLHRVFTSKPSVKLGNTPLGDPETGIAQWIGILARGITLFQEESGGRHAQIEHLWQNTQTLQFDKKRFVIVSEVYEPSRTVFFTDHYTKSAYFVRFAASQHRFMIKMRQWSHTLKSSPFQFRKIPDVGADTGFVEKAVPPAEHMNAPTTTNLSEVDFPGNHDRCTPGDGVSEKLPFAERSDNLRPSASNSTIVGQCMEETSTEESAESNDGHILEISLEKDPNVGLGLTLVDGNLNGIKGVYVKSVSEEGAGKKGGINVGDRLISVNDVSLLGKDRHATVDLVKRGGDVVRLKIFRLDAISSALPSSIVKGKLVSDSRKEDKDLTLLSNEGTRSRTPPAPRNLNVLKKRVRAVSDFGAVGDTLPDLNSEDLLASLRNEPKFGHMQKENFFGEEDERKVRYNMPVASMYKFEGADDEITEHSPKRSNTTPYSLFKTSESEWLRLGNDVNQQQNPLNDWRTKQDGRKKPNLDWADDLDDIVKPLPSGVSMVTLKRNESGSLGFQIASSGNNVYIKQVTAMPALSCPEIHVGDKIIMVNDEKVQDLTHQQVVDLLRKGGDKVVIGLQHSDKELSTHDEKEQTVRAVVEKSQAGSLGLSLAKKTGFEGIYIRMISSGSAADNDGTLQIGDKIWEVNGQSVRNCTPGAIVDLLKAASNPVEIVVKRAIVK